MYNMRVTFIEAVSPPDTFSYEHKFGLRYWQCPSNWSTEQVNFNSSSLQVTLRNEHRQKVGDVLLYVDKVNDPNRYHLNSEFVWKEHVVISNSRYRGCGIATWLLHYADQLSEIKRSTYPRFFQDLTGKEFLQYRALAENVIYDQDEFCVFKP